MSLNDPLDKLSGKGKTGQEAEATISSATERAYIIVFLLGPKQYLTRIFHCLPLSSVIRASYVSRTWKAIIDTDPYLWQVLMESANMWFGGDSENLFSKHIEHLRRKQPLQDRSALPLPHPYKILFKSRHLTRSSWLNNNPKRTTFPIHGSHVVTCLLFIHGRIISASDDNSIHVYSPSTGSLIHSFEGHAGGIWCLAATKNMLVSGSSDRIARIWDMSTGRCTHAFGGHTSTIRALSLVMPEVITWTDKNGNRRRERWPKRPLLVTGSRDYTCRVWNLPKAGDPEYKCRGADNIDGNPLGVRL